MAESDSIHVEIRSRDKVLFDGKVYSVSSFNEVGEFDVLPQHANFVTLIRDKIILNKGLKDAQEIDLESGVVNVVEDKVDVYLGV